MSTLYTAADSVSSFLSLFNPESVLLQTFDDSGSANKALSSVVRVDPNKIPVERLQTFNEQGAGIFFAVNKFNGSVRKNTEVSAITALFVDMDGKEPDAKGLANLPDPSLVVQSKNGKHLYWLLEDPLIVTDTAEASKLFKGYQQTLATMLGGDMHICDLSRCMRLPGFNHMKDNHAPFEVSTVVYSDRRYSLDLFPKPIAVTSEVNNKGLAESLDKLANSVLLAKEGDRNDTLNKAAFKAGGLLQKGLIFDVAYQTLLKAAVYIGLDENEARVTIESGLKSGQEKYGKNAKTGKPANEYADTMAKLEATYKDRLWFNQATNKFELDGVVTSFGEVVNTIRVEADKDIVKQDASDFVELAGVRFGYHPVKKYLESLEPVKEVKLLPTLARKLFGVDDNLSRVYLMRWLIGAVARALKPGCQMDTALVIKGEQGSGKTSFFRAISKTDWFTTLGSSDKGKDELMKLSQFWIVEYGEIESAFRRKDVADMKAFLTETIDTFRKPYGRENISAPRSCVFAGTTNEDAFLTDDTGSRRFWVIDAGSHVINVKWVQDNVDLIWAEAKTLYLRGEQYWLTPGEQALSTPNNEKYATEDPWVEILSGKLELIQRKERKIALTTVELCHIVFNLTPDKVNKGHSNKVGKIMKSLGYKSLQKDRSKRYWLHTDWDFDTVVYPNHSEIGSLITNYSN